MTSHSSFIRMPCSFCSVMMIDELVELDVQDGSSGCANPVINPLSKLALPPQTWDGKHSVTGWKPEGPEPELPEPKVSLGKPLPLALAFSKEASLLGLTEYWQFSYYLKLVITYEIFEHSDSSPELEYDLLALLPPPLSESLWIICLRKTTTINWHTINHVNQSECVVASLSNVPLLTVFWWCWL